MASDKLWEGPSSGDYSSLFSTAVLRGTSVIEDYVRVEIQERVIFCGLFHGRPCDNGRSRFYAGNLYNCFRRSVQESDIISESTIGYAIVQNDEDFENSLDLELRGNQELDPNSLVGVLTGGELLTSDFGDSRTVLCSVDRGGNIQAEKIHQQRDLADQACCKQEQPSVADKDENLIDNPPSAHQNLEHILPVAPVQATQLRWIDEFVIFATKAFWDLVPQDEAAHLVHVGPRQGAAKRLVQEASRKRESNALTDNDTLFWGIPRRQDFDDISVLVLFTDRTLLEQIWSLPAHSERNFVD